MGEIWVEILLFLFGVGIVVLAFFKPKDQQLMEEKIEKIIEDFTFQFSLENDEFIQKIKESQQQFFTNVEQKVNLIEERLNKLEKSQKTLSQQINPKYQEVMRLYQNGESIQQIARKTNMGQGEVELVIELMKKGFSYV
ncbi:DUF2802 domain-containing protein [Tepidibacillus fermentans]|uniref:Helix-turn-helix resolvase-like protein n=1 Tax=Tepidibacillus fermentans TaxID=1281767 RepID=A0A4R3KHL9_9BACI|nr:DUF2802 domain-containing protein [Tepidibacillus fermentans]TCS82967.1 helix-turn-helix resolvase-like protein [Tepidibacillus fermentans]